MTDIDRYVNKAARALHETPGLWPADHARAALDAVYADIRRDVGEEIAQAIEACDPVEWALAGMAAGEDAARIARAVGNG